MESKTKTSQTNSYKIPDKLKQKMELVKELEDMMSFELSHADAFHFNRKERKEFITKTTEFYNRMLEAIDIHKDIETYIKNL